MPHDFREKRIDDHDDLFLSLDQINDQYLLTDVGERFELLYF